MFNIIRLTLTVFLLTFAALTASAQTVDLTITMSGPASVQNGDTATYDLSIVNGGPSNADGATFSDVIPNGFVVISATCSAMTNGGVCPTTVDISGQTVSGTIPTLPNAGSVVIQIATRAPVRPAVSSYTNTATVSAPTGREETNANTNTAVVNTTVTVQAADLSATASGSQSSYAFGDLQSFTFDFINNGPGPADGARVTGSHSSARTGGVTGATYTDLTVSCSAAGGAICPNVTPPTSGNFYSTGSYFGNEVTTWPSGGSLQFTVSYKITDFVGPATGCGDTNRKYDTYVRGNASIGSYITDPTSSNNNSASLALTGPDLTQNACPGADLTTSLSVDNTSLTFGSPSIYTAVHTNLGAGSADGSSIKLRGIANLRGGNVNYLNYEGARIVSCTSAGGAVCPNITAAATNLLYGGWRDIYSGTVETWPSGGSLTIVYEMTPKDYTLSSSCGPDPVSYANLSVIAFSSVASGTVDPDTSNNSQNLYPINGPQQVLPDCPNADIAVTNNMDTQDLIFGNPIEYTTVWKNNGPDLASGVTITSRLGRSGISGGIIGFNYSDLTILDCTATGGVECPTPTPSSTGVAYTYKDLINETVGDWPSGATISLKYKLTPTSYVYSSCSGTARGSIYNTGFFSLPSGLTDPVSVNNSASVTTSQGPLCMDGSITASIAPAAPYPDGPLALTIEQSIPATAVTATNWEILDILPAGFVFDGVDASCAVISGNATCGSFSWNATTREFSSVTPTAEAGSVLRWTINGQAIGFSSTWTNSVNLQPASTYIDPLEASNIATVNLNITGTDPKLTKQAVDKEILAGDLVTYRLTVSNPSNGNQLDSFILTDQLPVGWVYDSTTTVTMTGGTTRINGSDPSNGDTNPQWTGFTVPQGGTIFIEFEAKSPSSLTCGATEYDNSATINYVTSGLSDSRTYSGTLIGNDNDNVVVPCSPELTKSYNTPTITSGSNAELTFRISPTTIGTPYPFAMSFSDTLPESLKIVGLKTGSNTCGGSITDLGGSALGSGDIGVKLTGGLLQSSGTQACSFTVYVTNKPALTNAECTSAPANFTNGSSNISDLVNLSNAVTNQCLRVLPTTGTLRITKALSLPSGITGPFTFGFSAVCDLPTAGTVYGPVSLTNFPNTRTVDIPGIPEGANCSVQETTPMPPLGYVWTTPSVGVMSPSTGIPANAVQSVTVTNALSNPVYAVKSVLSQPARLAADANQFDITYRVTVYNDGTSNSTYDLSDTLGLDADVSVVGAPRVTTSANVSTVVNALWNGTPGQVSLVTSEPIVAGENETFDLSLRLSIDANEASNDSCTGNTGRGLYNAASLTANGLTSSIGSCAPTPSALPVVNAGQSYSYEELRTAGQNVGTVTATNFSAANLWRFADSASDVSSDGFYQIGNDGVINLTATGAAAGAAQNDYETGDNSFVYAIQAGTAYGWSIPVDVTLMVTDIDEDAPVIVGPDGDNETTSGPIGSVYVLEEERAVVTYTASDVSAMTWTISGGVDAGRFIIDPTTGVLVFDITTDYEIPADTDQGNDYVVVIRVTDQVGNYTEQTLTVTVLDVWDTLPGTVNGTDVDGDGIADSLESTTADRDGDGIVDASDYDPQGYFYCEDDGSILTGGSISVTGPTGSNALIGTANNIRIVKDGFNDGEYQWFATAPGTYTMSVSYPTSVGIPSTTRTTSGTLDVTTLLPANPASIGSSQFGSTGFLSNFWDGGSDPIIPANTTTAFYTTFVIEEGDPHVLGNNIPVAQCGENNVTVAGTTNGAEANGGSTTSAVFTIEQTRISTQDTTLRYSVSGTATSGMDFTALSFEATIPAGDTSVTVPVSILEDTLIEGDETISVTLTAILEGDLTTQLSATASLLTASVDIIDDDFATVIVSNDDLTTTEGRSDDDATMSFSLGGRPTSDVVLTFTGDAQCTVSPSTMTFSASDFAAQQVLSITAINDEDVEGTHSCQPTMTVASSDTRFDNFDLALATVTVADDLVDQVRNPLAGILQNDFEQTVATQSREFAQISKGVLGRLQSDEELRCGELEEFDVDGAADLSGSSLTTSGTFGEDVYDCNTNTRHITNGSFALNKSGSTATQAMLSFTMQREQKSSDTALDGLFFGGYLSRTSLNGQTTGDGGIDGVGAHAGLYGARELQDALFLDYYAAASVGNHSFDMSLYAPSAPINVDGDYQYRALFGGAALSGEVKYDAVTLRPRVGLDLTYASASDADVSASQLGFTDTGRIVLDPVNGSRLYVETVWIFGDENEGGTAQELNRKRSVELAPRFYCTKVVGRDERDCGYGGSISVSYINLSKGSDLGVSLDYENNNESSERFGLGLSYSRDF